MDPRSLGVCVQIEDEVSSPGSVEAPGRPPRVHRQPLPVLEAPNAMELDQIERASRKNGPPSGTCADASNSETPDAGLSRTPSPQAREPTSLVQTFSKPYMNRFRMLSCCFVCFGNGLNDSAPGALIPSLERDYKIGYAVVSLIFVSNALGFISAACFTDALAQRLGRAKALMIAMAAMFAGYFVIVFTPPFPAVVLSFYLFGLGMGISLALNNVFVANLANNTAMLGTFHGSYGIGGIIGPLIATAMVSHGFPWSRYYLLALGVAFLNLVFAGWAFWTYEQDAPITLLSDLERTASKRAAGVQGKRRLLREALRQRTTVLGAIFIFAYQGAEVSISGWVISFLITYRNGNPADVGYVTAGFWAGITLGRFLLSHPAHKIGEKRFVAVAVVLSAGFQLIVWLVPDVVGNAVAVSIVGLLLGPVYPCAMAVFSQHLGRRLQVTALGFISAMGSSGGAVAPFMTGLGAQAAGTWILHPVCIGLYVLMEACWLTMPRSRKRTE